MSPEVTGAGPRLHAAVLAWFDEVGRDLPWRDPECSPWGVYLSEVMSQQTPVARVLPVWERWLERWPTPADLAADQFAVGADAVHVGHHGGQAHRLARPPPLDQRVHAVQLGIGESDLAMRPFAALASGQDRARTS